MELGELTKNILLVGIGAMATSAEKTKEIVDELIKKGEITIDQGKTLNEELIKKGQSKVDEQLINHLDKLSPEQLESIKAKINELEESEKVE